MLGLIVLTCIFIVSMSGFSTIALSKFYHGHEAWSNKKEPQNRIGKLHKFGGYFIILCGIAANASGIISFQKTYHYENEDKRYVTAHLIVFTLIILVSEIIYRLWLKCSRVELTTKTPKRAIKVEELKDLVYI